MKLKNMCNYPYLLTLTENEKIKSKNLAPIEIFNLPDGAILTEQSMQGMCNFCIVDADKSKDIETMILFI